jgi:MFS family permease
MVATSQSMCTPFSQVITLIRFDQTVILLVVSAAGMIAGLSVNIQNAANQDIQQKLHAYPSQISLSLSLFILVQGVFPLAWAAISEIKGRKVRYDTRTWPSHYRINDNQFPDQIVYLVSFGIFVSGSITVATAQSIRLFIGMRVLQAVGYVYY